MIGVPIQQRGDDMIALLLTSGGVFTGRLRDLAAQLGVLEPTAARVLRYIRTHPDQFGDTTIQWNALRRGYALIANGVSAWGDDGAYLFDNLVRFYTERIHQDERTERMFGLLQTGFKPNTVQWRKVRATRQHVNGTIMQAQALLGLIGP